jgi:hypothetical protein
MIRVRSITLALALAALTAGTAVAQQTTPATPAAPAPDRAKNTFFVELLGNGLLYSLNYERFFTPRLGIRIGGMYVEGNDEGESVALGMFPVMGTYLFTEGNHHFETGLGAGFGTAAVDLDVGEDWGSAVFGTATLGYRYQKPEGGVLFRAGFTPIFGEGGFLPWFGLSVGYAF